MIEINLSKKIRRYPLKDRRKFLRIIDFVVKKSSLPSLSKNVPCEINFVLVSDKAIEEYNNTYLQHEGPTDVITFDYLEDLEEEGVLGEVLISLDTAKSQAAENNTTFQEELVLYIIHGILHLCGYDDHENEDIVKMRRAEAEMMNLVKAEFNFENVI